MSRGYLRGTGSSPSLISRVLSDAYSPVFMESLGILVPGVWGQEAGKRGSRTINARLLEGWGRAQKGRAHAAKGQKHLAVSACGKRSKVPGSERMQQMAKSTWP